MSEIEKMYENSEINKIGIKRCSGVKQGICQHNCNECESFDYKYPAFTAEKQIELIKWLILLCKNGEGIKDSYISMEIINNAYRFYLINPNWVNSLHRVFSINENFEEMLAGFINNLWQDLTKEEKETIRGILRT